MRRAAILDIGSSKIVCLSGTMTGKDDIVIQGAASEAYPGFRYGAFEDRKKTVDAICNAIEKTEAEAKTRIRELAVAVPASFTRLELKKHSLDLSSQPRRITSADIDMLINESITEPGADEALIHSTPVSFHVDDKVFGTVPVGQVGSRLEGVVSHMYVSRTFLSLVEEALRDMDIRISMCVASSLAQALFLLSPEERLRPAAVVDVGYNVTNVFLVENAAVTASTVLEVGGMHLAGDLCYGLQLPMAAAERLKRRYVFSLDYQDSEETVRTPVGTQRVSHADVQFIVEARAQELAQMVAQELESFGILPGSRSGVCLTGGGLCEMRGGPEFFGKTMEMPVKSEMPWMPRLRSPVYASALGMLDFALHEGEEEEHGIRIPVELDQSPILQKIKSFFNM